MSCPLQLKPDLQVPAAVDIDSDDTYCFDASMYAFRQISLRCVLAALLGLSTFHGASNPIAFVQDGQLLVYENAAPRVVAVTSARSAPEAQQNTVSAYWGYLDDNRLLVTLEPDSARDSAEEHDHHCSTSSPGHPAWLVGADGNLQTLLCTNVLRAYPAPAGGRVALISPERELSIWHEDVCTSVTAPGKISNVGWSPDGERLVVSMYPPDWSEGAVSSASTTAEFLRLQNADLYLFDAVEMKFVGPLTDDPGTEYGAFFSPDGASLYYHWLHITEDEGGLMRLDFSNGGTTATAPAMQLTNAGNDEGETPLGRVTTYLWQNGGRQLVFESGLPDGSGEIWTMTAAGEASTRLAAGRKPQVVDDSRVVFMGASGISELAVPEVKP